MYILYIYMPIFLSIHLSIYLSIYLSTYSKNEKQTTSKALISQNQDGSIMHVTMKAMCSPSYLQNGWLCGNSCTST